MTAASARIVFPGGSLVVPAYTAYDRQQLVEHVRAGVRRHPHLEVRVDHGTWLAEGTRRRIPCHGCAQPASCLCRRADVNACYCASCALMRPHLTVAFLSALPQRAVLRDVQAHYAYRGEWVAWTRWPRATPAEIIADIHLQRRFAPVLTWRCAEICLPQPLETPATARRPRLRGWALPQRAVG